jgi:hypothetical protein
VTDKRVLGLVRQFLAAGVMREHGSPTATPSGTPQGAILSPLLANVDRRFEAAWEALTPAQRKWRMAKGHASFRLVRYADDRVPRTLKEDRCTDGSGAAREMEVGPPRSPCRGRLLTGAARGGLRPRGGERRG